MEAFGQLPRRLTKLYSDTKRSCDVVTTQETGDANFPESVALHLEFRIQRERLSAWGLEWSDDSAASEGSIDEAVARAGLTETVTSVLRNIQDVLEEAERIHSSGGDGASGVGSEKNILWRQERSAPWSQADQARYEQLAKDLTSSIDLLYDLSRTRQELRQGTYPGKGKSEFQNPQSTPATKSIYTIRDYLTSEETLVNPTRVSTAKTIVALELPLRLDPTLLDLPEEEPPPYDSIGATLSSRMIAYLRQPAPPSSSWSGSEDGHVKIPVLVEFAPFDPAYRATGVSPPSQRLDALLAFYARSSVAFESFAYGTLACLGFFEDPKEPRFGLVYELPKSVSGRLTSSPVEKAIRPASLLKVLQASSRSLNASNRTLPPGPALEDRLRLAFNLVRAFCKIHDEEHLVHKDVNSANIIFFPKSNLARAESSSKEQHSIRSPYLSSFDLFTEFNLEKRSSLPARNIYRRPDDPRVTDENCQFCTSPSCRCPQYRFDIYALGLMLLEIGLWTPLADLYKSKYSLTDFKHRIDGIWVKRLAPRCGTIYMEVVRDMLLQSSSNITEEMQGALYDRWLSRLRRCCLLDEEEDEIPDSLSGSTVYASSQKSASRKHSRSSLIGQSRHQQTGNPPRLASQPRYLPSTINEGAEEEELRFSRDFVTSPEPGDDSSARGDAGDASMSSVMAKYQSAASIIQRAWRSRSSKVSFNDYRRKVSLIQRWWRQQKTKSESMDSVSSTLQSITGSQEEIIIESQFVESTIDQEAVFHIQHETIPVRPKLRIQEVKLQPELVDLWHETMLPRLEHIVERALRDSPETVTIDLVSVGESALTAKPTVLVTCTNTARVKRALARKFTYDREVFDVKVRRGKMHRSKAMRSRRPPLPPHRSMASDNSSSPAVIPLNPFHQQRPLCGASIGAFVGKHLPPVSFGGVVNVDGELFGMTVHHLLDDPSDDDEGSEYDEEANASATRSSNRRQTDLDDLLRGAGGHPSLQTFPTDSMFPLEISDDDDFDLEDADISSDDGYSSADDERSKSAFSDGSGTQGDTTGIVPGSTTEILVTQPALDDVEEDFFPAVEDRDEDHLDSHKLGYIYASSGIRRWNRQGIVHEIDWALLSLDDERLQPSNLVQGGKRFCANDSSDLKPNLLEPVCRGSYLPEEDEYPSQIAGAEDLGNLQVHCFGRTSGLKGGVVGPAMSSVRIYKRRSFSRSWHVTGEFGVGGDSGAWVIDNEQGRVCGHVLAWCERNAIAYICPMEVLLEDMKRTLGASRVCLPGSLEDLQASRRVVLGTSQSSTIRMANIESSDLPDVSKLGIGDGSGMFRSRLNGSAVSPRLELQRVFGGTGQMA